ncbi:MAG: hypothetical protein KDF64_03975 [Geminicoccaceae bacterium]|nr:hypothetical protein [Geminicoccaceae bacterium]
MATRAKVDSRKRAFLQAIELGHTVKKAAGFADISRSLIYRWKDSDPDFSAAFEHAQTVALEVYEEETRRRAIEGIRKLRVHEGQPVFCWVDPDGNVIEAPPFETREEALEAGYRREPVYDVAYSDTLAIFRMKAIAPDKYCDRQRIEASVAPSEALAAALAKVRASE